VLTVELGRTGWTKSLKPTFPWYAISARVGILAFPETSGSYGGQLGAGEDLGFLAKFANAVWRLCESSTSAEVAVDLLNVPKRMGTIKW
jgi:hypothetical protein